MKIKSNQPDLQQKVFSFDTALTFKKVDPEDKDSPLIIEGSASTNDMDRMRDIIDPKAWKKRDALKAYQANPIILAYHRHDKPIGRATEVRATDNGLSIKAQISKSASEVYSLIQEGILKAFSVGFIAKDLDYDPDEDIFNIKDVELVEVSVVSVPANPYTTFSVSKSFDNPREFEAFKKSLINDEKENPETIEENKPMEKSEKSTPSIDVSSLTSSVAETVMKALEEREAAKEAERKAKEARDIEVKTAAERLLEDVKKDLQAKLEEEKEGALKEVTTKFASELEEKQRELEELQSAMRKNKMHYPSDAGEDNLTDAEKDNAVFMAKLFAKPIDGTKYFQRLVQKSGREHWESGTLSGWEEEFSTRVHNEMRENLIVEPLFTTIPMSTPTMHMPVNPEAGYAEWIPDANFRSSLATGQESPGSGEVSSTGSAVDHQLKENTITAYKLATKEFIGYEEEEDSIVALLPIIRDAMARRMAKSADLALLRGAGAGADPITGLTGLGSSVTDVSFSVGSPAQSTVASVTYNDFITARQNLGLYGDDPSNLVWIVSPALYYHLLGTSFSTTFLTMDKIGDRATVLTGQIGAIAGTPVVLSRQFDNTNIETPVAGTSFGVLCRPTNFLKGELRGMRVESDTDVFNQKRGYVATRRFGFKDLDVGQGVVKFVFSS